MHLIFIFFICLLQTFSLTAGHKYKIRQAETQRKVAAIETQRKVAELPDVQKRVAEPTPIAKTPVDTPPKKTTEPQGIFRRAISFFTVRKQEEKTPVVPKAIHTWVEPTATLVPKVGQDAEIIRQQKIAVLSESFKTTVDKQLKGYPIAIKEEAEQLFKEITDVLSKQLDDEIQVAKAKLEEFEKKINPQAYLEEQEKIKKIVEDSKKALDEMEKLIKQKGQLTQEIEPSEKRETGRVYNPDAMRQTKISEGTKLIAALARDPSKAGDIIVPKPAGIKRLLDPDQSKSITEDELRKMRQDPEVKEYLENYLKAIESIGEHFFNAAKTKDPQMSSGTMVIEDSKGPLHKFLRDYVEISCKLNEGPKANIDKPKFVASSNAYGRVSSHFKEYYKYGTAPKGGLPPQYGIDLKNPINTFTEDIKPNDIRSHFLFGKIDPASDYMFIKFETHGLGGVKEAAIHGVNFVKRAIEKAREKKEPTAKTQEPTDRFAVKDRRENTPKPILKEYGNLIAKKKLTKKQKAALLRKAKARGVSAIMEELKDKTDDDSKRLSDKIIKTYGKENLDIRVGNEVIFRNADLPTE
jgi:hypothetical protein